MIIITVYLFGLQIKGVLEEIFREEDVVPLRIPVMKVRETVMDLEMEVSMMDTKDVKEILFVDPTIVSSLEPTSIPRMTVVKDHLAALSASQTGNEG